MSLKLVKTIEDRQHIHRFARNFYEVSPYHGKLAYNSLKVDLLLDLAASSAYTQCLPLLYEENGIPCGCLLGVASSTPFSDDLIASELCWWVDEEYRGTKGSFELVLAYEDWAKRVGCKMITMALLSTTNPKIDTYYRRMGYEKCEVSYVKEL